MKLQVVFLSFVVAVFARPEAGYNYNPSPIQIQPSISYLPSHTTSSLITEPSSTYLPANIHGHLIGTQQEYDPNRYPFQDDGFTGIQDGFDFNRHQNQRSVYFYAAPDDEQASRLRIYVQPSSGRNTKVIFIKAPGQRGIVPEVIAPPSQAEEKTLVYVLSKHQQQGGSITIPSSLGVKQAKPEVHFIKYRNHQDVQNAVSQGLVGQRVGTTLEDLGSAQVFTGNLGWRGGDQTGITGITNPGIDTRYGPPTGSGPY